MNIKTLYSSGLVVTGLLLGLGPASGAPILVSNANDSGSGSLRTAVAGAVSGATIQFASGLSGQTITLTSGEIVLANNLTIDGSELTAGITLSGGNASRIFNITSGSIILIGLNITDGNTPDTGGDLYSASGSSLHIERCTFTGANSLEGGAILNDGTLLVENSTFTANNSAYGGAIQCRNLATINHCTISGNNGPSGGGGIFNKNTTLTLIDSIVAGNTSYSPGADIYDQYSTLVFSNSNIVLDYTNQSATSSGPVPHTGAPLLAALGNYGGPTQTMPLQYGSPAIDAGGTTALTTDQRGLPRVVGAAADLGAVELQATEAFYNPVQSTADSGPWSLRAAIAGAASGATITFSPTLVGKTITLTSTALTIANNLTISGLGATNLAVSGNNARQVFIINSGTVNLSGLTIRNGRSAAGGNSSSPGVAGGPGASGGGIFNSGTLSLTNCVISGNATGGGGNGYPGVNVTNATTTGGASGSGAGIFNQATLRLYGCTISDNTCGTGGYGGLGNWNTNTGGLGGNGGNGGGIYNASGGNLTLLNCTFSGNSAGAGGGGGSSGSQSDGSPGANAGNGGNGGNGGAIYSAYSLSLTSCTIDGNYAGAAGGGGFAALGYGNGGGGAAGSGGGLVNTFSTAPACDNNILAGNTAGSAPDVSGSVHSLGHNLVGEADGSGGFGVAGDIIGTIASPVNPLLGSFQLNGGETATLALLVGSPALEVGDDTLVGTDQRGFPRPNGAHVDIGAYELDISSFPPLSVTVLGQNFGATNPTLGSLSVTFNTAVNAGGLVTVAGVQYGLSPSYGGRANLNLASYPLTSANLSVTTNGFVPGIIYHYRIEATNADASAVSPDQTFLIPLSSLAGDLNGDGVVSPSELNTVYSNFLSTSPPPNMVNVAGLGRSNVTFSFSNFLSSGYTVQSSTDLINWTNLGTATPQFIFTDTNVSASPDRFYRLTYP